MVGSAERSDGGSSDGGAVTIAAGHASVDSNAAKVARLIRLAATIVTRRIGRIGRIGRSIGQLYSGV